MFGKDNKLDSLEVAFLLDNVRHRHCAFDEGSKFIASSDGISRMLRGANSVHFDSIKDGIKEQCPQVHQCKLCRRLLSRLLSPNHQLLTTSSLFSTIILNFSSSPLEYSGPQE
jgi:hypothetical protein